MPRAGVPRPSGQDADGSEAPGTAAERGQRELASPQAGQLEAFVQESGVSMMQQLAALGRHRKLGSAGGIIISVLEICGSDLSVKLAEDGAAMLSARQPEFFMQMMLSPGPTLRRPGQTTETHSRSAHAEDARDHRVLIRHHCIHICLDQRRTRGGQLQVKDGKGPREIADARRTEVALSLPSVGRCVDMWHPHGGFCSLVSRLCAACISMRRVTISSRTGAAAPAYPHYA